ncbi:MAG: ribbon-helix-helix protein, CopG family [Planctomycetes bacterium]|nr:ribbon-helix-helix protein, CopG family [Planctomycetota bacterium]
MNRVTRIAISLERDLLKEIERLREATGESRSALVRRAVLSLLRQSRLEERTRCYLEGYTRVPETEAEVRAAEASAVRLLAREPWE